MRPIIWVKVDEVGILLPFMNKARLEAKNYTGCIVT